MITTSSVFLETLCASGITHVFVNWGSDHPAMLEDVARRLRSSDKRLKFITCPNEMVALNAAQGFSQLTDDPSAVIVHVDVGTQGLAGAIHNVDRARIPILIYAGTSPFTLDGELKGSRNEWIMWMQDPHDQASIVRQYMRYTAQINSGKNVAQVVKRALQIAKSEPKGPVYLTGRREVMESEAEEAFLNVSKDIHRWPPIEPSGLTSSTIAMVVSALLSAKAPLIITTRMPFENAPTLAKFSQLLSIPIFYSCASISSIPLSHPNVIGVSYLNGRTNSSYLADADVILIFDCDVPWISYQGGVTDDQRDLKLKDNVKIFVFDSGDPLKQRFGMWHVPAHAICRADTQIAMKQIMQAINIEDAEAAGFLERGIVAQRALTVKKLHDDWIARLRSAEEDISLLNVDGGSYTCSHVMGVLRSELDSQNLCGKTIALNEGITNYDAVWAHLMAVGVGGEMHMLTSGGSNLGWALGASIGVSLGLRLNENAEKKLIVCVVGDGSYMFGIPSSVFWMARKYEAPFLTIILNNGGWKAPKMSMLGVHPTGLGADVPGLELGTGFGPHPPNYSGIAVAASDGWAYGRKLGVGDGGLDALKEAIQEGLRVVLHEKRCAVLDCQLGIV